MSTEPTNTIKIDWEDLNTRKVDQRLKEQEALERNRRQAEMNPLSVQIEKPTKRSSIFYNSAILMAVFGLLGGLLAWGGGELLGVGPSPELLAAGHMQEARDLIDRGASGRLPPEAVSAALQAMQREYAGNPYFALDMDISLTTDQRAARKAEIDRQQAMKNLITNLLSFGVSGMLIAMCLSIAEPVIDRNKTKALVNGVVGAALGLMGGALVSLFIEKLYDALVRQAPIGDDAASARMLAQAVKWGVLGLFLTMAPGILMGNVKKLSIGLMGGLVGGLIGGALFDPIYTATASNAISRLIALLAIGGFAGALTGLIENATKGGWLKVTAGLIAGKQFILYRNPTFIGSGPECPIYLFRDPKVGKRHAAVHIVPGGFEIENLPLGGDTFINGKSVKRARLRAADEIQVGGTKFVFQEKTAAKG